MAYFGLIPIALYFTSFSLFPIKALKLKVTVVIVDEFTNFHQNVLEVAQEVSENFSSSPVTLIPNILKIPVMTENGSNPLKITRHQVCEEIIDGAAVVIMVLPANEITFTSSVAYGLGFFHVPVISTTSRSAQLSDKSIYPSFLRTVPPWSYQADIWIKLLTELDYDQVILIYTVDPESQVFIDRFVKMAETHRIEIQKTFALEPEAINPDLKEVSELTSNVFLLHVNNPVDADAIFRTANKLKLTGQGKAWILSETVIRAESIPSGSLAIKLDQTVTDSLSDAFSAIHAALENMNLWSDQNIHWKVQAPHSCSNLVNVKNKKTRELWTSFYKNLTNIKLVLDHTSSILKFNKDGDRFGSKYEIINLQTKATGSNVQPAFVKVGEYLLHKGNMDLVLEKSKIVWPGNLAIAPPTFSLPGSLVAVTVEDGPFIYKWGPVSMLKKCENMGAEVSSGLYPPLFNLSLKQPAIKAAKWHPCHYKSQLYCCTGLCVQILAQLTDTNSTKFTFDLHLVDHYGNCTVDRITGEQKCSGIVDELVSERADIAVAAISIDPNREKVMDFSKPWLYHGITIMEMKKPLLNPMETFMQPFKLSLWTCLFASVVIIGVSLFALDKLSPFSRFYSSTTEESLSQSIQDNVLRDAGALDEETPLSFSGSVWFVWGVLLDSGIGEKTPRSFSGRILGMVWCGFCTIMVASYTANLAAFLVLDQPTRSLSGITDTRFAFAIFCTIHYVGLVGRQMLSGCYFYTITFFGIYAFVVTAGPLFLRNPSANFTFATVEGSATYMYFKRHVELSTMFRKMEGRNYASAAEGIAAVKNGSLDAFIWDSTILEFEADRDCDLVTSGDVFGISAYGVGLRKNSPWTRLITLAILELLEAGAMDKLDSEWIASTEEKECRNLKSYDSRPASRLGLTNMRDVFFLLGTGALLGIFLIIVEIIYKRKQLERIRKQQIAIGYGKLWRRKAEEKRNQKKQHSGQQPAAAAQVDQLDGCSLASTGPPFSPTDSLESAAYRPNLHIRKRDSLDAPSSKFEACKVRLDSPVTGAIQGKQQKSLFSKKVKKKYPVKSSPAKTTDEFGFGDFSKGLPQTKAANNRGLWNFPWKKSSPATNVKSKRKKPAVYV